MEKFDLDKLLIGGFTVNAGDVFSKLLIAHSNNTILLTQLLVKVIAIEKHLEVKVDDSERVMSEVKLIIDNALQVSSSHLAHIIAELATKQKD
jgi:hypothetical protein